jgi:hypothetical protein
MHGSIPYGFEWGTYTEGFTKMQTIWLRKTRLPPKQP